MDYNFKKIEQDWQKKWKENKVYKVENNSTKPKYYVLDMFPYPSGAGLHVGHPLGYIASDIYSRYKRLKGFNVLHPMGFDSFGLPAEQYAIETGQHPAETTKKNIETFKSQLDKIGFCYDWDREVQTSNPNYYKWTQKIFLELYNSYFCNTCKQAKPISELIKKYETKGGSNFSVEQWNNYSELEQSEILMKRRLAFSKFGEVNWCEALGTVLANDEVVNGVSERGGHPVEKKKMRQWYLRITAYADRLLQGLETVDFSDSMKEMQKNWIGRSEGAEINFPLSKSPHRGEVKAKLPGFGYPEYKVANEKNFENAKDNRKNSTEAESILWELLRGNKLDYKFRRQHAIENYIADFVCLHLWLIVEIDGGYHLATEQIAADKLRDEQLSKIGFTTIRFTNEQISNDIENVLKQIKEKAAEINATSVELKTKAEQSPSPLQGEGLGVRVYTTRPDTIFGVDFLVLAPELTYVLNIASDEQKQAVEDYITYVKSRSDRERQAEVKQITGCFTGAYAINPFDGREIPIYIAEYVLAGYGTGAIMAVPCGDERDFKFAQHFNIPITNIIGEHFNGTEANSTKDAVLQNSDFLNGLVMKDAMKIANDKIEELGIGKRKVNFRMRDAGFSRQRYWGEPFPIVWNEGVPTALTENDLPLELPHVEKYGPGPDGEGPLANITEWSLPNPSKGGAYKRETSTMPGYAGSSWYFLRYMDPENDKEFVSKQAAEYWNSVDLYVGGTEHAVGHLLYSRMWTKVLFDLGYIGFEEPFKKLLNQGMIQGSSRFVYRFQLLKSTVTSNADFFISSSYVEKINRNELPVMSIAYLMNETVPFYCDIEELKLKENVEFLVAKINVDVNIVDGVELDIEAFKKWKNGEYANAEFILEDGTLYSETSTSKYICGVETEKMSKSKYNTVNPDELCDKYGADTFRMYEMFLGPVEASKPWDTKGIEGVHRFIKKLWRLFYSETTFINGQPIEGKPLWDAASSPLGEALKVLHKTIKKIDEDTERFSYNTAVSAFMVCVNELSDLKCNNKEILEPLLILLAPYAPHIAEHLYNAINNGEKYLWASETSPLGRFGGATYPTFDPAILVESEKEYPVSINGKMRTTLSFSLDAAQQDIEVVVLENEIVKKWLDGNQPKKIVFVKGKMINVVL
jgi:leucyl-tRNA synthetase